MAPPPPDLIEDAIAEILVHLPPDEPEHLFRAALVCKPWLRILCDPCFLRRYRAFHGAPPLLGLLHRSGLQPINREPFPRFISTTSVPAFPQPAGTDRSFTRLLDCRHGRVLVRMLDGSGGDHGHLLVWDPVTGATHTLPKPDIARMHFTAAVFCAGQACNHLDCHGGPFRVAVVATYTDTIFATYASETGTWSTPTSVCIGKVAYFYGKHGNVLAGDEICFALAQTNALLATINYDWGKNCLSVVKSPLPPPLRERNHYFVLMAMEDSSLGLAVIVDSSQNIYSRKVNTDGAAQWVRCRVIDLEKVMPMAKPCDDFGASVVGFAEGVDAIFVSTVVGLFTIELKSGRVNKVAEPATGGDYFSVLPYMSFYTPDRGRLSSLPSLAGLPNV